MSSPEDESKRSHYDDAYDPETHRVGPARSCAEYAALLYERGTEADLDRAARVTQAVIALQVDDPDSRTHGQFPMRAGGQPGDLNAVLFIMPNLIRLLESGLSHMPESLAAAYEACVQRAVVATERRWSEERFDLHRDFKGYTNIFLIYIRALLLAGNHYDDERLVRQATAQWQRWFNHVAYYGIDEFASPAYGSVDYDALKTIHEHAPDAQVRREAGYVLEHLSAVLHATTHPTLKLAVAGSSRNYRRFLRQEDCESSCVKEGADSPFTPHAIRDDYANRSFPYEMAGRATAIPFWYRSWQDRHAAMGTMSGGNYFHQQIHCMVAVGESAADRAVLFIPGVFTPTSGFVSQRASTALCVFNRLPNTFNRTQRPIPDEEVLAYKGDFGIGLTDGWQIDQEESHIALAAYGHEVHVQTFLIESDEVAPTTLPRGRQKDIGQGRFHPADADFDAFTYPSDAVWFGCHVSVRPAGAPPTPPVISWSSADNILTVASDDGHELRLFHQPCGEVTGVYTTDWRTTPLFESPAHTLWPGALARRAAHP